MRVRRLIGTMLWAAVVFVPAIASAQSPAEPAAPPPGALLHAPRWEASGLIGLGFIGSDPMVGGTWTLSGGVRVKQRLAIAVEIGRQGYGNAHCKGAECRIGVTSNLCPCDEFPSDDRGSTAPYKLFSGSRYLAGPRLQLSKHVFTHVLIGAVSTGIVPTQFSIRPGIGRDFSDEIIGLRIQVDYEIVTGQTARGTPMSGLRFLIGFVAFGGHR